MVRAGSSSIEIMVGGKKVTARIDSGAEITILSSSFYDKLKDPPGKVKDVKMKLADKDSFLNGFVTKPINIQLGDQIFKERVYVAPISDEMLLGHDILHHLGVLLDLKTDSMLVNGESIPLKTTFKDGQSIVARVSIQKRTVIPPNTAVRVKCNLNAKLKDYYVEPNKELKLAVPRIVRREHEDPLMCFVNHTENFQTLKKGKLVGHAYEIEATLKKEQLSCSIESSWSCNEEYERVGEEERVTICDSNTNPLSNCCSVKEIENSIPDHLKEVFNSSKENLTKEEIIIIRISGCFCKE